MGIDEVDNKTMDLPKWSLDTQFCLAPASTARAEGQGGESSYTLAETPSVWGPVCQLSLHAVCLKLTHMSRPKLFVQAQTRPRA